jgi:hypothetical protein
MSPSSFPLAAYPMVQVATLAATSLSERPFTEMTRRADPRSEIPLPTKYPAAVKPEPIRRAEIINEIRDGVMG